MTIDENTRLDLRRWFEANMGERLAQAVMQAMPPLDYDQFATRSDVENLGHALRSEMADLRSELRTGMAELRTELRTEMVGLRAEVLVRVGELRTEVRDDIAALRGELVDWRGDSRLAVFQMGRQLIAMQIMSFGATMAAIIGLATYLTR